MDISENTTSSGSAMDFNDTNPTTSRPVPQLSLQLVAVATVCYVVIFVVGVIGNVLVIVVVLKNKEMKTSTNIFLANLSAADLLVLTVTMPSTLMDLYTKEVWYLGEFMCKFVPFLENSVTGASIQTIIGIALERYYAICRPLRAHVTCTLSRTIKILCVIWLISLFVAAPFIPIAYYKGSRLTDGTPVKVCRLKIDTTLKSVYACSLMVVSYVIPLAVLFTLYTVITKQLMSRANDPENFVSATTLRARKQVVAMLIIVVILFFLCHLPYRSLSLILIFDNYVPLRLGFHGYHMTLTCVRLFFYIHSIINPIVYSFMSSNFRKSFKNALVTSRRKNRHGSVFSTTNPMDGRGYSTLATSISNSRFSRRASSKDVNCERVLTTGVESIDELAADKSTTPLKEFPV
ncbi:QRFP-like peptide receptor [Tubulanus polymorphus]|uniref:QRFP-like peptide receptor n=1 Tax=Tubulanus polymorphus TaxID=672921 RepID=UPI003DA442CF